MKKNLKRVSLILMLAFATTVSLNSCGSDDAAEGDNTEANVDGEKKCEEGKCEEGKCEEGKCEGDKKCEADKKCEEGKCEGDAKTEAEMKCEEGKCKS